MAYDFKRTIIFSSAYPKCYFLLLVFNQRCKILLPEANLCVFNEVKTYDIKSKDYILFSTRDQM